MAIRPAPLSSAEVRRRPDICVVGGAGHVGLPLSIVIASRGVRVLIYDKDQERLDSIGRGSMPFMDYSAEPLLQEGLSRGDILASSEPSDFEGITTIVITVGTPVDDFLNPSLQQLHECIDELLPFMADVQTLILRSTVFPGTTEWLDRYLRSRGRPLHVAFCPERVVQGHAVDELQQLPQIVSGVTPEAERRAAQLFSLFAPEVILLSPLEAELAKLFSNAYRYIRFAIANEFFQIANSAGVDYTRVFRGMKRNYERLADLPGPGFCAGPCLFKDTMQLSAIGDSSLSLGYAAMRVNEGLPLYVVNQLAKRYSLKDLSVGLMGMAFKADSDDPRSSLGYKLKKILQFRAKQVLTTDPYVSGDPDLRPLDEVLAHSDVLILCVPHQVYRDLRTDEKIVVDIWNHWTRGTLI